MTDHEQQNDRLIDAIEALSARADRLSEGREHKADVQEARDDARRDTFWRILAGVVIAALLPWLTWLSLTVTEIQRDAQASISVREHNLIVQRLRDEWRADIRDAIEVVLEARDVP